MKDTNRETVVDEAKRVAWLLSMNPDEHFPIRICAIDTLQEIFGGVDGPIRHKSDFGTDMAMVWKAEPGDANW